MNKINKIILGIDPGTAIMGYGIIEYNHPNIQFINYGTITTTPDLKKHERLGIIHTRLNQIISKYNPDTVAIEDIFYFKNKKTLVEVSQARGIALLSAAQHNKECYEFTPLQIKQAVTGYGRADKKQVQIMVQSLLNLEEIPKPDDAADALATAICCAHSMNILKLQNESS